MHASKQRTKNPNSSVQKRAERENELEAQRSVDIHPDNAVQRNREIIQNTSQKEDAVQTKLTVGKPNDRFEQEADATADSVMSKPFDQSMDSSATPGIQRKEFLETSSGIQNSNDSEELSAKSEDEPAPDDLMQTSLVPETDRASEPKETFLQRMADESYAQAKQDQLNKSEDDSSVISRESTSKSEMLQMISFDKDGKNTPKKEKEQPSKGTFLQTVADENLLSTKTESPRDSIQKGAFVQLLEDDALQTKRNEQSTSTDLSGQLKASKGGGEPLPKDTRSEMETRFGGRDFSNVRVHNDSRSAEMNKSLNSKAFANGKDVYFNTGQFDTGSTDGKKLLAHELTHTIQQGGSGDKVQRQLQDPVIKEDGEVPFREMDKELKDDLGDDAGKPLSAEEKAEGKPSDTKDQKKEKQADIDEEGNAKPPVDREEESAPGIEKNVDSADKQIEEEPETEEPTTEEVVPEEEVELTKSQQAELLAQKALQEEQKIKTPKAEKAVKPPKLKPAVDADGQMLPINPTIARVPLIAAQIQAYRDKAQELDEKATDEERFAEALRGGIQEIYSKIYDSNDYLDVVEIHTQERKELLDQTAELVKVNEERTATVAKDAPEHVEGTKDTQKTIDTSVEKSDDQKSEASGLNDPEMDEESKDNEEANADVEKALEETPEHAKAVADEPVRLIEQAEGARIKHEEIKIQIATNRETVAKTEEDIRGKQKHNALEKAKLDTTVGEPDRIKKEAKTIQKEAKKMKKKSKKDEKQLHKTYDDYLSKMSSVPGLEKIDGKQDREQDAVTPDFFVQRQEEDSGPIPGKLTDKEKKLYRENREKLIENIDNDFDRKMIDQQMEMEDNFQNYGYWDNVWYGLKWSGLTIASMVSKINWVDAGLALLLMVISPPHLIKGTWDIVQKLLFPTIPENDPFLMTSLRVVTSAVSIVAAIYGMLLGLSAFGFVASFALSWIPWFTIPMVPWVIFFKFAMGLYGGLFGWYLLASTILHAAVYLLDLNRAGVQDSAKGLQEQSNQLSNDIDQASFSVGALLFMKALGLVNRVFGGGRIKKQSDGSKGKKDGKGGKNEELLEKETAKNEKQLEEGNSKKEKSKVEGEEVIEEEVGAESETKLEEGKVETDKKKVEGEELGEEEFGGEKKTTDNNFNKEKSKIEGEEVVEDKVGTENETKLEEGKAEQPKNKIYKDGDTIPIESADQLAYTEPIFDGFEYNWNLYDTKSGAIFTEYVHATEIAGPDMYLRPRNARIEGVPGEFILDSGGKFRWTVEALRLNIEAYEVAFGKGKKPPNLNGQLAESNMANFQAEYIRIYRGNTKLSPQRIANEAIRHVSFGKHRISAKYGELKVTIEETMPVDVDGVIVDVPTWVEIEALPTIE